MNIIKVILSCIAMAVFLSLSAGSAMAITINVTVDGSDAIFLAGRTDVIIPAASQPWNTGTYLKRHNWLTPEEILETLPPFVNVVAGDIIRLAAPATGGVNFFNGFAGSVFGPGGNGLSGSNLNPLGGISGYKGPQGPLTGIFLNDSIPGSGPAPSTLDFTTAGLGINFLTLAPQLRQIFYIGDGITSTGAFQTFVAPAGATRLFLGIPDGWGFNGAPGYYDDNDGSYRACVEISGNPAPVPEPGTLLLLGVGLASLVAIRMKRK